MKILANKAGVFFVSLLVCVIVYTFIWEQFVAENLYHCSDPGWLGFLFPGDWCHVAYGDTLKPGWSLTRLWVMWDALIVASFILSALVATMPVRQRKEAEHIEIHHEMA
jgi:hypothetical protein